MYIQLTSSSGNINVKDRVHARTTHEHEVIDRRDQESKEDKQLILLRFSNQKNQTQNNNKPEAEINNDKTLAPPVSQKKSLLSFSKKNMIITHSSV
jgi:hypothetical protein